MRGKNREWNESENKKVEEAKVSTSELHTFRGSELSAMILAFLPSSSTFAILDHV